jgi:membrane fusion protein (multidrug efflux system)
MRKVIVIAILLALVGGGAWYYRNGTQSGAEAATSQPGTPGGGGAPGGGGGGRGGGRGTLTVDTAPTSRQDVVEYITAVGNLVGQLTVDVQPRVAGRVESITVKLGDRVAKGQQIAKIEDREISEQLRQAQANLDVNRATVTNRESDERVAASVLARTLATYERGLVSKQVLEDAEARHNSSVSQVIVAKAQQAQTTARLDELKITLSNTNILSPVDGFVSRRLLDPGAFAGANTVILTVVDISTVRLVTNLVEKGFKRVVPGVDAEVAVDAFPDERFRGEVSRVSPVFDPATRTAPMEIEVPNPGFRLKPGMYARVRLTVERRANALTVPRGAVVDTEGKRGVFLVDGQTAKFREVQTGLQDNDRVEILDGLTDGERVVTVGALALRDGDRVQLAGGDPGAKGGRGNRGGGRGAKGEGKQ